MIEKINQGVPKYDPRAELLRLKNDFSDEIPAAVIHSDSPEKNSKSEEIGFRELLLISPILRMQIK